MIAGVGGAGKTEFTFDLILNASLMHGWKWLILSPETGDKYEIIEMLVEKLSSGARLENDSDNPISEDSLDKIMFWLNQHFRILDPTEHWKENLSDLQMNITNFFDAVNYEENRLGGKFDGILIDPFNELDIEIGGSKTANIVKNELITPMINTRCVKKMMMVNGTSGLHLIRRMNGRMVSSSDVKDIR
jgi:hypothetical protein